MKKWIANFLKRVVKSYYNVYAAAPAEKLTRCPNAIDALCVAIKDINKLDEIKHTVNIYTGKVVIFGRKGKNYGSEEYTSEELKGFFDKLFQYEKNRHGKRKSLYG